MDYFRAACPGGGYFRATGPPAFTSLLSARTIILDCGASHTALGIFHRKGSRLILADYAAETFAAPVGRDDCWLENTRAALPALRAKVKGPVSVVVVLPAHLTLNRLFRTPRVGTAQRERIIRFEAAQGLPFDLTDVVWDTVTAGESASDLEVLLTAAKLSPVESLCAAVQAAGFEPRLLLPAPLATLAAFRLAYPAQTGSSLVLNLGARATTLLLVGPQRFAVRTLAFNSHDLAPPIARDPAGGALAALATRLVQEITRSVLHFRRQSGQETPAGVYLAGDGAPLADLAEVLAAKLQVPVGRLDTSGAIEMAGGPMEGAGAGRAFSMTDLIGAAATQLRPDQAVLNLLPPKRRSHENLRRRQPWLIATAVLTVVALLPPVLHFRTVADEARRKATAIEHELAPLRERDARNRANLAQLDELRRQVVRLQGVHDRRDSWLRLFGDLQDRLGRVGDVWLEKLSVTSGEKDAPRRLLISGRMLDRTNPLSPVSVETTSRAKALLRDLDQSPQAHVAEEGQRFDRHQPGILQFTVELVVNPAHPL